MQRRPDRFWVEKVENRRGSCHPARDGKKGSKSQKNLKFPEKGLKFPKRAQIPRKNQVPRKGAQIPRKGSNSQRPDRLWVEEVEDRRRRCHPAREGKRRLKLRGSKGAQISKGGQKGLKRRPKGAQREDKSGSTGGQIASGSKKLKIAGEAAILLETRKGAQIETGKGASEAQRDGNGGFWVEEFEDRWRRCHPARERVD